MFVTAIFLSYTYSFLAVLLPLFTSCVDGLFHLYYDSLASLWLSSSLDSLYGAGGSWAVPFGANTGGAATGKSALIETNLGLITGNAPMANAYIAVTVVMSRICGTISGIIIEPVLN